MNQLDQVRARQEERGRRGQNMGKNRRSRTHGTEEKELAISDIPQCSGLVDEQQG